MAEGAIWFHLLIHLKRGIRGCDVDFGGSLFGRVEDVEYGHG